jgi:hypothetical protein
VAGVELVIVTAIYDEKIVEIVVVLSDQKIVECFRSDSRDLPVAVREGGKKVKLVIVCEFGSALWEKIASGRS